MKIDEALSPSEVLASVAAALPESARANVIVVGSLAAGHYFFAGDGARAIRTKDVDCLFSPWARAVAAAEDVTEQLLDAHWTLRENRAFGAPGSATDPVEALPRVRLLPPGADTSPWFLELLSAPPNFEPGDPSRKKLRRLQTSVGDFSIASFDFLALAEWQPIRTSHEIHIARPEMMALANLLHHPRVDDTLIASTTQKRSNKDLGRVLALAYLTVLRDRRDGADELATWPVNMWAALQDKFGATARGLAAAAGSGLEDLLSRSVDFDQALMIANLGLLASMDVDREAFRATAERVRAEVLEELVELAS